MHQRIVTTVGQLRQDLARHLDKKAIYDACRQAGHRWRDCVLTPAAIIHWFIIQVLHGNTAVSARPSQPRCAGYIPRGI